MPACLEERRLMVREMGERGCVSAPSAPPSACGAHATGLAEELGCHAFTDSLQPWGPVNGPLRKHAEFATSACFRGDEPYSKILQTIRENMAPDSAVMKQSQSERHKQSIRCRKEEFIMINIRPGNER